MKTIEVSDEMYEKLISLGTEMTTQDNRCTAMPHMFQIREQKEVAAYDGCGEEIWVDNDGDQLRNQEEIIEFVKEYIYENDSSVNCLEDDEAEKECAKKVEGMDEWELDNFLEDLSHGWRKISVTTESHYKNTFFTAKACQEHIDANHYHYTKPDVYLHHAFRNPEMELVSEFLCELVGEKIHK